MKDSDSSDPRIHLEGSATDRSNVYQVGRGNLNVDASVHYHDAVKLTPAERIATEKPPLWEYLLFAAALRKGVSSLEGSWIGYCYGSTVPAARYGSEEAAIDRFSQYLRDCSRMSASLNSLLDLRLQERAFGRPGEPGDVEPLNHLAQHVCSVLAQWLDLTIELRSTGVPSRLERLRSLSIQISDKAIRDTYAFIQRVIGEFEELPQRVASLRPNEPLRLELTLTLVVDDAAVKQHGKELRRLGRPKS